jgi:ADP-ribose pyrophosphatase YjhB (NUDIX family)
MVVRDEWYYQGKKIISEWHNSRYHKGLKPITQVYGVCFYKDKILIIRSSQDKFWNLPGGQPEKGETMLQALIREVDEEASADVKSGRMLGYSKTIEPDRTVYQLRYVAELSKIKKPTPDPDNGIIRKRRFIPIKDFNKYLQWGDVGKEIIKQALKRKR